MSCRENGRHFGVPDFGETVRRSRLVDAFARVRPPATVIAAPAAYGKSVLAAQFATISRFDTALWVHLPQGCATTMEIAAAAVSSVAPRAVPSKDDLVSFGVAPTLADLLDRLDQTLPSARTRYCLVLDNVDSSASACIPELVAAFLNRQTLPTLIVTVRAPSPLADLPFSVWQLGPHDLLLDESEAARLAESLVGQAVDPDALRHLMDASGGQAGLLSVLARCGIAEVVDWRRLANAKEGITGALRYLAQSQLGRLERSVLTCISILGQGTVDGLRRVPGCEVATEGTLRLVASVVPIVRLHSDEGGDHYAVHELAQVAYAGREDCRALPAGALDELLAMLAARDDAERLISTLCESDDPRRLETWLGVVGVGLLKRGRLGLLERALGHFAPMELVRSPRLLALKAATELDEGRVEEAIRSARVAREIAEQEDDHFALANALLTLAQATLNQCDLVIARTYLQRAIDVCGAGVSEESLAGLLGRRLLCDAVLGDFGLEAAIRGSERHLASLHASRPSQEAELILAFYRALSHSVLFGRWADSASAFETASRSRLLTRTTRAAAAYDYYASLIETGRIAQAGHALEDYEALVSAQPGDAWSAGLRSMLVIQRLTVGQAEGAIEAQLEAARSGWEAGDRLTAVSELASGAVALAGNRRGDDALAAADTAVAYAEAFPANLMLWASQLARATALLLVGDSAVAERDARMTHDSLHESPVAYYHLQADLILAVIECQRGDGDRAASRLREHRRYITSGSANWLCAMYSRAFPDALALIAAAAGNDELPVHMLRTITEEYAAETLEAARMLLPPDGYARLSSRTGAALDIRGELGAGAVAPTLRVRLFGGLEVRGAHGLVADRDWRKRKARLLFSMLATRCGRDVPREQLIDYLWPEMGLDAGLNNFYVAWSCMKRALTPGLQRGAVCPYVDHRGGVCKLLSGVVETDLAEFEAQLSRASESRLAGDEERELSALRRVCDVYRGDLLPGDAYDDWFAALRERCRHDYEDAMLRAAEILEGRGDIRGALALVRKAIEHDPWREDLYQSAMRLQVASGQRSAAIQTYLQCRARLVEDLGIDPSAETSRLYESVLCMEGTFDDNLQ